MLVSWQSGAGVYVDEGGYAALVDSNVYQNEALLWGGGLLIRGTAALTNVNVYANNASLVCASSFELCPGCLLRSDPQWSKRVLACLGRVALASPS